MKILGKDEQLALVLCARQMRSWFLKLTMKCGFKLILTKMSFIALENVRIIKQLNDLYA
jgi:hypothetical protein